MSFLWRIRLQRTLGCRYGSGIVFSSSLAEYPEVGWLDHVVVHVLMFWGSLHSAFRSGCTSLHAHRRRTRVPFSHHHLLSQTLLLGQLGVTHHGRAGRRGETRKGLRRGHRFRQGFLSPRGLSTVYWLRKISRGKELRVPSVARTEGFPGTWD